MLERCLTLVINILLLEHIRNYESSIGDYVGWCLEASWIHITHNGINFVSLETDLHNIIALLEIQESSLWVEVNLLSGDIPFVSLARLL